MVGDGKGRGCWQGVCRVAVLLLGYGFPQWLQPPLSAHSSPAQPGLSPVQASCSPLRILPQVLLARSWLESWGSCSCSTLGSFVLLQHPREEGSEQRGNERKRASCPLPNARAENKDILLRPGWAGTAEPAGREACWAGLFMWCRGVHAAFI